MNTKKFSSPKFGEKLNIKRDKICYDPDAMGVYCKIKGKIGRLTLA